MVEGARCRSRVVVATTFMVAATILPRLSRRYAEQNPQTNVVLRDLRQAAAVEEVRRGKSNLAVLALDAPQPGLRFEPPAEDELVVVVPPGHPLVGAGRMPLAGLVDRSLMLLEQYALIEAMVEAEGRQAGTPYRRGRRR